MLELLAPAGNRECFLAAVNHGADAVYLGLKNFSARKSAGNFTIEELAECVRYANLFGVKVYVAINTVIKDCELSDFFQTVALAAGTGAHAFILQDVALGRILKRNMPELTLHLSTQAGVCNRYGAEYAKEAGFSRVILARETALFDIEQIAPVIETEVFVQGALCSCVSGQCYMSSMIGGNSGNRGLCKQPCRKLCAYYDGAERLTEGYSLSLSDLSVGKNINQLIEAGASSFKIEGRMRRPEYVAAATGYYRSLLDGHENPDYYRAMVRAFNRGNYTRGLAFGQDRSLISAKTQGHIGEIVGKVTEIDRKTLKFHAADCKTGDCFKILKDEIETGNGVVTASRGSLCTADYSGVASVGDAIAVTTDRALSELLAVRRKLKVSVDIRLRAGEYGIFSMTAGDRSVRIKTDFLLEKGLTAALTEEEIKACFLKTDGFPIDPAISVDTDRIFMPKSKLNAFRRELYALLFPTKNTVISDNFKFDYVRHKTGGEAERTAVISGIPYEFPPFISDAVFAPADYTDKQSLLSFVHKAKCQKKYLYLPAFFGSQDAALLEEAVQFFDGFYSETVNGVAFSEACGKECFLGTGCNLTNGLSLSQYPDYKRAISREISLKEAARHPEAYAFVLGNIPVMQLAYCPFGKHCDTCKIGDKIILKDAEGRRFRVRRYRLSTCRFEIFNPQDLVVETNLPKRLFDFRNYDSRTIGELLRADGVARLKEILPQHTVGNAMRGIR